MIRRIFLFHQCSNNSLRKKDIEGVKIISIYFYLGIEAFQVSVGLSCPYKHNRLATDVRHGYGRPDFVVDGVKLGENDPIYSVRIVAGGMIGEGEQVSVQYHADETGFHATGSHVPQAPPMPAHVQRLLDHLAKVNGLKRL